MTILALPKRGDLACVTSKSTGLSGIFLVTAFDVLTKSVEIVLLTSDLSRPDPDWPKYVPLAEVDSLIACTEAGF